MHHKDLEAWKRAVNLAKEIYLLTNDFPKHEIYGLSNQMRRAAVSVFSLGSLAELETQLFIAKEIDYISEINVNLEKVKALF